MIFMSCGSAKTSGNELVSQRVGRISDRDGRPCTKIAKHAIGMRITI